VANRHSTLAWLLRPKPYRILRLGTAFASENLSRRANTTSFGTAFAPENSVIATTSLATVLAQLLPTSKFQSEGFVRPQKKVVIKSKKEVR
ncbi:MAG: hypothetical protein RR063_03270, partial [Anaerovoracaceae bacterium]